MVLFYLFIYKRVNFCILAKIFYFQTPNWVFGIELEYLEYILLLGEILVRKSEKYNEMTLVTDQIWKVKSEFI